MAVTQTGRATIFGFNGDVSFTGIGTLFLNSGEFSDEFTLRHLRDGTNEVKGFQSSGRLWTAHLVFVPVAASGTNTLANAKLSLDAPAPLAQVVLTNFDLAELNTNWVYTGGWKISFSRDDLASYELDIQTNPDEDVTATVS